MSMVSAPYSGDHEKGQAAWTVAMTGGSGMVGQALQGALKNRGHRVIRLVRRQPRGQDERLWDPSSGVLDPEVLRDADALVHLAGETVSVRWSEERKERIRRSRKEGTELIARTIASMSKRPHVWISASAIGYYGHRGDEELDEFSPPGEGFLASVCKQWESATRAAEEQGVRVVRLRIGTVLSKHGGALRAMLKPFQLGIGGRVGSGQQFVSWIEIGDLTRVVEFLLGREDLAGAVNATAPQPVRNADFARVLGRVLGRPAWLPTPRAFLDQAMGREMVEELLLASARVLPRRLLDAGFAFQHPGIESALRAALA